MWIAHPGPPIWYYLVIPSDSPGPLCVLFRCDLFRCDGGLPYNVVWTLAGLLCDITHQPPIRTCEPWQDSLCVSHTKICHQCSSWSMNCSKQGGVWHVHLSASTQTWKCSHLYPWEHPWCQLTFLIHISSEWKKVSFFKWFGKIGHL